jgi:hypothetical protein
MTITSIPSLGRALGAGILLGALAGLTAAGAAAPPAAAMPTNPPVIPKAVFATDLPAGRDPFYPNTSRFKRVEPQAPKSVERAVSPLDQLVLKGVSISDRRRLALVNNRTLAEGEKGEIKLSSGTLVIVCLEVTETSALVQAVETKEKKQLHLRKEL